MTDDSPRSARGPASRLSRGRLLQVGLAVTVVVAAGSVVAGAPVDRLANQWPGIDKVLHTTAFLVLFAGAWWAARYLRRPVSPLALAVVLALVAAADEVAQGFQPARDPDPFDLLGSLAGIALGWAAVERQRWRIGAAVAALAGLFLAAGVTVHTYFERRHLATALRYERAGDFVNARREYRLALADGVRSPGLFNELAWVEIESGIGNADEAVAFAEQAMALDPDEPDILDSYGWALHHAGRSAEALPFLERAYQGKPDMFCIHYHLGEVYLALGDTTRAVSHLRQQVTRRDTREAARAERTLSRLARPD